MCCAVLIRIKKLTTEGGRGVGGSTLINGLTYGRGSSNVYDLWQDLGDDGSDWNSILPYFEKSTSFVPVDVAPYQTYNASAYSDNGLVALPYPTYVYDSSTAFIEALSSVNVSIVNDLNLWNNIGAKQEPLTLDTQQQRVSSYDGYYKPVRTRPNLTVRPLSQVQQVILEVRDGGLVATGVVYSDMVSGLNVNVTALKEVIAQIEYLWENTYYLAVPSMVLPQYPNWKDESFIAVTAALLSPVSKGNVTLQTNSIQDGPAIDINYLESPIDEQIALIMFRSLRTVLSQPVLSQYTVGPDYGEVVPGVHVNEDKTILEYIKKSFSRSGTPLGHAACYLVTREEWSTIGFGFMALRVCES
ncbi:hypothetical protein LTR17_013249 [Elasticomyces elasticus]|nr:hypothetical protein LTR17_013249 [Elasticomyces elasticus]